MRGKCASADCLVGDDEELAVAACTSCKNPVHHICSNAVHEGSVDIRVCSHRCAERLGLTSQQSGFDAAPTSRVAPKKTGKGCHSGQAKRKRDDPTKRGKQPNARAMGTSSYKSRATSTKTRCPSVKKTPKKSRTKSTSRGGALSALLESCSDNDNNMDSVDDGRCGSDAGSDADGDEPSSKPKKFYFTPAKDLDLLMEVLNIQPYAAEHGSVTERYEDVTSNLNEHWESDLCARTVKERFSRLVKEFKATDCAYRKKSGVEEEYTEHKRLLQDIVDELQGIEAKKKKKKAGKQAKSNRLESDGERLREQALNRRSQRGTAARSDEVASENNDVSADETSERSSDAVSSTATMTTRGAKGQVGGSLTTAQANAATVDFIAKQSKRHKDEYQLLHEALRFKQTKAKMEEARWKEELEFRKREAELNAKKWSDEVALRRSDIELRREELAVLKYQLNFQPILDPSTQAIV